MPDQNNGRLQLEKLNTQEIQRQAEKLDTHIDQGNIRVEQIYKDFREYVDNKGSNNWPIVGIMGVFLTLLLGIAGLLYQQINAVYGRIYLIEGRVAEWRMDCSTHQDLGAHAKAGERFLYLDRDILGLREWKKEVHPLIIGLEKSLDAKIGMIDQKMETKLEAVDQNYFRALERLEAFDNRMNKQEVFKQQAVWFDKQLTSDRRMKSNASTKSIP